MRKHLFFLVAALLCLQATAQHRWAAIKGNSSNLDAVYGTMGTATPYTTPGTRNAAAIWTLNGKMYLYGGYGVTANSDYYHSDLWEYDTATHYWRFLNGGTNALGAEFVVPGTQGVADPTNTPGGRLGGMTWAVGNKLYMFGGSANTTTGSGSMNDLWVYDLTTGYWTWLTGSTTLFGADVYGTQGVPAAANTPGSRGGAATWVIGNSLYLFGGGSYNDTWRYDIATGMWTWIKGFNGANPFGATGNYGTMGVTAASNLPMPRSNPCIWLVNGKLYMYGGDGGEVNLGDVWTFDFSTNNWTWINGTSASNNVYAQNYGIQGVASSTNSPAGRVAAACWTANNECYFTCGEAVHYTGPSELFNSTWEYNPTTNNWTWLGGDTTANPLGVYGPAPGVPLPLSRPGGRIAAYTAMGNKLYLYGGNGYDVEGSALLDDMWELNTTTLKWNWTAGHYNANTLEIPGSPNIPAELNTPGTMRDFAYWQVNDTFYVLSTTSDRLWRYQVSSNNWVVVKGGTSATPIYGTLGVAAATNTPGARVTPAFWQANGKLYLLGGVSGIVRHNDFWEYDPATNNWRWLSGTMLGDQPPVSSAAGIYATANTPGTRFSAAFTTIGNKLYLFGGTGTDSAGNSMLALNDLWCYDVTLGQWAYLKGKTTGYQYGKYGTIGVAAAANAPGARATALSWAANNKFYMYGGRGLPIYTMQNDPEVLDDLWEYDPATGNWRWINGSNFTVGMPVYGTQGVAGTGNSPSARTNSLTWVQNGKLCFMGGYTETTDLNNPYGDRNDMWQYDLATGNWTWVDGSANYDMQGFYNRPNEFMTGNTPGCRLSGAAFLHGDNLYIFGGNGQPAYTYQFSPNRNDMWLYEACDAGQCYTTPPSVTVSSGYVTTGPVALCNGAPVVLNAGNPGSHFLWNTGDTTGVLVVTAPGSYSVTVTSPGGLMGHDTMQVTGGSAPVFSLGPDTSICSGAIYTLNVATPGATYYWSDQLTTPIRQVTTSDTLAVTVYGANGCYATDSVTITAYIAPNVHLGNDTSLCPAGFITLAPFATGATGYLWSTGATTATIQGAAGNTYSIAATGAGGCTARDTIVINTYTVHKPNLGADTILCANVPLILNGTVPGGAAYSWSNGAATATDTITGSGTYRVSVTDIHGCITADTLTLTALPLPSATGMNVISVGPGTINFSPASTQNTISYLWLFGDGSSSTATTVQHHYNTYGGYTVQLILINACGNDTITNNINVSDLGVSTTAGGAVEGIMVFPNPAHGYLTVRNNSTASAGQPWHIRLSTISGIAVADNWVAGKEATLQTSSFAPGAYQLMVTINEKIYSSTILIQ